MNIIITLIFLFFSNFAFAAPDSTLSISPAAVDATTIAASDENSRNNSISSWANAHDHNDIDQSGNTLSVGDATAGNKTIQANNADASKPYIRWDDTNDRWIVARDGSTAESLLTITGATTLKFVFPQSPVQGDVLFYNGTVWDRLAKGTRFQVLQQGYSHPEWASPGQYKAGNFTRDTALASGTQTVTGVGFTPQKVHFLTAQNTSAEASIGFDDGSAPFSLVDYHNTTADQWTFDTTYSIRAIESSTAEYGGKVLAFNSDGFVISWTRTSTPSGTINIGYIAER